MNNFLGFTTAVAVFTTLFSILATIFFLVTYKKNKSNRKTLFTINQLRIIQWCARECARQCSGEYSVVNMVLAYAYAYNLGHKPGTYDILQLAMFVEPDSNKNGFRKTPVTIDHRQIPVHSDWWRSIYLYCEAWPLMTPEQRYREFEIMHPFIDGNGRVGAILFNWDRLGEIPMTPPAIFGTKTSED